MKVKDETLKKVTLRHLIVKNKKCIGLQFYPDKVIQSLIKQIPNIKWSQQYSLAYTHNSKSNLDLIFTLFKGVAWVDGKYFFKDIPINQSILEPNYNKFKQRISKKKRKCLDEYIDKLQVLRYSENTLKVYVSMFEEFMEHYYDVDLLSINEQDIRAYLLQLVKTGKSSSYQNQAINAIKFYYEIVLGLPNRYYHIDRPRKEEKIPLVLSVDEVQRIINSITNLKHKAIITTIYSAGLRVSELLALKVSDIQSDRKIILIRSAKGKKDRTSILGDKTLEILRKYYKEYKPTD